MYVLDNQPSGVVQFGPDQTLAGIAVLLNKLFNLSQIKGVCLVNTLPQLLPLWGVLTINALQATVFMRNVLG